MLNTPLLPDKRWMSIWIKCTAVLALLNLILALFNASYVPLRDIYLRYTPQVVHLYDPIKGIEPHPQTEQYQETFERLLSQIPDVGLDSPDVQQSLERLQQESNALSSRKIPSSPPVNLAPLPNYSVALPIASNKIPSKLPFINFGVPNICDRRISSAN